MYLKKKPCLPFRMFIEIASKLCFLWFPVVSLCAAICVHVNVCTFKSTRAHVHTHTHAANVGPRRCSGGGACAVVITAPIDGQIAAYLVHHLVDAAET